jgi:LPS-assembly protein
LLNKKEREEALINCNNLVFFRKKAQKPDGYNFRVLFVLFLLCFNLTFGIEVFSKSLEREPDGWLSAREEVEVYYKDYYIRADKVRYNPQTKEIIAEGEVYVRSTDGKLEVKGSYAYIDLDKKVGYFLNAEGRFQKFYFKAERVEMEGDTYMVEEGEITTCPPDRKEMVLCFSKARIDQRYVISENNSLRLFRVPFAYLPLFAYPVGERRSGLLPPTVGSNTFNSFIYQQPIYWAISKNKDATLTIDLRDKQAKGFSVEYRQAFFKEDDLQFKFSYYKEPIPPGKWWEGRDPTTFRKNRYRIQMSLDLEDFKAGLDTISDPYFLEDTSLRARERTVPYLTSYVTYKRDFERFMITFEAKHFYDTASPNNKGTLQKLPEVALYWKSQQLWGPIFFSLYSSYTNFYREEGLRGQRLALFPEFSIPKNLFGRVFYSNLVFENLYYFGLNQQGYKETVSSLYFSESVPLIFDLQAGNFKFKNFLKVGYSFREKDFNNPRFDNKDQINKTSQVDAIWTSGMGYKDREFLNLYVSSAYNYLGKYTYEGITADRRFLPIRAIVSLKPFEGVSLTTDSLYDIEGGFPLRTSNSLSLSYKKTGLTLGYQTARNLLKQRTSDQTSLSFGTSYGSTVFGILLTRDNRIGKDLVRQASLDYKGACWSFGLLARDNYDGTKGRYIKELYLTFNLFDLQRLTTPLKR